MKRYGIIILVSLMICSLLEVGALPSIQDRVNAASPGDTIYIPAGEYTENIIIDKPLTIIGENKDTTKIKPIDVANPAVWIKSSDVIIKNFTIYCDTYTNESTHSGLLSIAYGTTGISNVLVENNIIGPAMKTDGSAGGRMGIAIGSPSYNTSNITIKNNEIKDIRGNGNGIMIWSPKAEDPTPKYNGLISDVVIESNYIHNIRRTGIESAGNIRNITIKNNTIRDCGNMFPGDVHPKYGNGIALFKNGTYETAAPGKDSERRDIIISNNTLENMSNIGLYLFGSSHNVKVEHNSFNNIKNAIMLDSIAGEYAPDPSVPLPSNKYKQKDDVFTNILIFKNSFGQVNSQINLMTTYQPVVIKEINYPVATIVKIMQKNKEKKN